MVARLRVRRFTNESTVITVVTGSVHTLKSPGTRRPHHTRYRHRHHPTRDPEVVVRNYNRHRHYSTHPVRGHGVRHERPSTVDYTIVGPQVRVGVRRSHSRFHGFHHLTNPLGILGVDIRQNLPYRFDTTLPYTSPKGFHFRPWSVPTVPVQRIIGPLHEPASHYRRRDSGTVPSHDLLGTTGVEPDHPPLTRRESTGSGPLRVRGRDHRHGRGIESGVETTILRDGSNVDPGSPLSTGDA